MPLWSAFCGGAYESRGQHLSADACINLYLETLPEGQAKRKALYGTPGLRAGLTVGTLSCRGNFNQDGRTWSVVGAVLYELDIVAGTSTALGAILDDGLPVSWASNGRGGEQLAICGGGQLRILDLLTNTLSAAIVLPFSGAAVTVVFLNGYFILLERGTVRGWFSALEDGTSWDALDFFARSQTSDTLVGMLVVRDNLWTFGTENLQVWYNGGEADNPFVPYPGSIRQEGATSPTAIVLQGESAYWLSQDAHGRARIVTASGDAPQLISTPPIDTALASYETIDDCEAWAYTAAGHAFVGFTFPTVGVTWCYDVKEQAWHQRSTWNTTTGQFERWRVRGIASTSQGLLVGDYATGDLCWLDLETYTDNGRMIRRLRRAPYLSTEADWLFLDAIELGLMAGYGLASGQGSAPVVMLAISKDYGHTFGPVVSASMGAQGQWTSRAVWRRLGRVRADRLVLEVTVTDPVPVAFGPGLFLRVTPGEAAA